MNGRAEWITGVLQPVAAKTPALVELCTPPVLVVIAAKVCLFDSLVHGRISCVLNVSFAV